MFEMIDSWKGSIEIDGVRYNSLNEIPSDFNADKVSTILLCKSKELSENEAPKSNDKVYNISVKKYMTEKSKPEFDFMARFNNDNPMPLCNMVGTIKNETRGMYYMELKACTNFEQIDTCMKCGRIITNPISKFFGMGPECGQHNYTNPFDTDEELLKAAEDYKKTFLGKIHWEGWVIKKAITKMEEV